ncbi:Arabidopsis Toxicos en Levadura 72, DAF-Like gene 1 [Hibiscus trionum]|uniref:RING-type E3 ubiquitin transferase n=1 Tax=Hibiscus trionum TaxID=183268 RepID=A0A9W7HLZ6_HIBTR|nr:Arabidopsis Toxicos en Levadura 72, DAF-Like gene 1 [Hibiscus trionum]
MMQAKVAMVSTLYHRPHRHLLGPQPNASPTPTNEGNFDTNMVIILAALLCALVCVLGLNSIMRCAWRCGRRSGFDASSNETVARLAASACLKKSALGRIPVAVYGPGMNMKATDCLICLGEFMDGEKVRVLPKCNHGFHVRCIDTWLMSGSSCPACRRSLLDQTTSSDAAAVTEDRIRQHGGGQQADVADEVG